MSTSAHHERMPDLNWRIHTPNLLQEVLNNKGAAALKVPLTLLGQKLHELAALSLEINDPRLHLMMMDLTLYAQGDPEETPLDEVSETRQALLAQIAEVQQ
ncbi:MAG: hypothetical protein AAGI09_02805 [Pseudomonadota bacterium]